jgi:protein-S-isoprenylcysteine O-methyltransferase Ste14
MLFSVQIKRHLKKRTLIGVPELAPEARGIPMMVEGVYARHRHPRYLQLILVTGGLALFANYLAAYVAFAMTLAVILIIIPMEERELRQRFGQEYADYCARTPRLIPRLRRRAD